MKIQHLAGIAALALLSACGGGEQASNVTTTVDTDNGSEFVVPAGNIALDNAAAGNTAAAVAGLNLAPDGLTLVSESGSARQLTFEAPRAAAIATVTGALGKPIANDHNDECGGGPMDMASFKGGLTLFFLDGRFAGWDVDPREKGKFSTAAGIGIGSTLKQLRDVVTVDVQPDSSLGIEFNTGGLSGLLSANTPEGRITRLWAGNTCIFR